MHSPKILEWPHPYIDEDWNAGKHQWREITPLAYRELKAVVALKHDERSAFMQAEPIDILPNGDGLYVCCKRENGFFFTRLLPGEYWWKRDYLPTPEVKAVMNYPASQEGGVSVPVGQSF